MRKRSIPILVVALVASTLAWRISAVLMRGFGYEMGATYPAPAYFRLLWLFALASALAGLSLLLFDFMGWTQRKKL
jgi:hypothetical protein